MDPEGKQGQPDPLHLLRLRGENMIVWTSDITYDPGHTQSDVEDNHHDAWVLLTVSRFLTLFHVPCHTDNSAL